MKDLNVPQVLSTQQVTTLPSFSESGAREHAAVGRQLQRAPQKHCEPLATLRYQHADTVSHGCCEIFIHRL